MIYPDTLQPNGTEQFIIDGKIIDIPKCIVMFEKWKGVPVLEAFGGKPVLDFDNKPVFAEIAIMLTFQNDGWETRWVETYGKKDPILLADWKDDKYKNQVHQPFQDKTIITLLNSIAEINNNTFSGCWDVVAKKNEQILFAESKRTKKDSIRSSQVSWLAAGLKYGLKPQNFLMVQWDFK